MLMSCLTCKCSHLYGLNYAHTCLLLTTLARKIMKSPLSICLSVHPSVCLSVHPSVCFQSTFELPGLFDLNILHVFDLQP